MSQPSPTQRAAGFCTTTTSQAAEVPRPPKIANSGQLTPRMSRFGRARKRISRSRRTYRSAITDAWAIVNESIAPNAYMSPRKLVFPGRSTAIEMIPAKTTSDSHGVLNFGCRRRKTSGSWR